MARTLGGDLYLGLFLFSDSRGCDVFFCCRSLLLLRDFDLYPDWGTFSVGLLSLPWAFCVQLGQFVFRVAGFWPMRLNLWACGVVIIGG